MINGENGQSMPNCQIASFGEFRIDFSQQSVWRGRQRVELSHLSYRLLAELVRSASKPVSIKVLSERVWQTQVTGDTVKQRVKTLRRALGDDANSPRYIENVRGHGYRLVSAVDFHANTADSKAKSFTWRWVGAGLMVVLALLFILKNNWYSELASNEAVRFALMPIKPIGSKNWTEALAAGLDAELKNAFGQLSRLELVSMPLGNDQFKFDAETLSRQFGVEIALTGAVRYDLEHSRVVFELIDCNNQSQIAARAFDLEAGFDLEKQKKLTIAVADFVSEQLALAR